nr:fusion protein [Bovine narmovirus 1]
MTQVLVHQFHAQIDIESLTKIGIISGRSYDYKLTGRSTIKTLVISLVPSIGNTTNCTFGAVANYKQLLINILAPISNAINISRNAVEPLNSEFRFFGAVLAGVALGVATSAQITAAIALHNSIDNARNIQKLMTSLQHTQSAITKLQDSTENVILAVQGLQEQINDKIIPHVNKLSCDILDTKTSLLLSQYYSELLTVFGPNLRDPVGSKLSIQAISRSFGDNYDALIAALGYTNQDFLEMLESGSITGQIIDVNLQDYYIALQVEFPTLLPIPDAKIQTFNLISFSKQNTEWMSVFPSALLIRSYLISNINLAGCVQTRTSYICTADRAYPLSEPLYYCAKGNLTKCARSRVIHSHVPRFALTGGIIYANCAATICRCITTQTLLLQDPNDTIMRISAETCPKINVNGIYIQVGRVTLNTTYYTRNIQLGEAIVLEPVDVGTQLAEAGRTLIESKQELEIAKNELNTIKQNTFQGYLAPLVTTITVVIIGWLLILTVLILKNGLCSSLRNNTALEALNVRSLGNINSGFVGSVHNIPRSPPPSYPNSHSSQSTIFTEVE